MLKNLAEFAGVAAIVYGIALISAPVAWIAAGVLLVAACEARS